MEQQNQQNQVKNITQIIKDFDKDRLDNKIKKCCEQKIQEILNKDNITDEDVKVLSNLYDLYKKCCGCVERNYQYSNTKEDFEALKGAYLGNRAYENDFIFNLLLKVKILETILNK